MRPLVQTITSSGIQAPLVLDMYVSPFELSQTLNLGTSATISYTFQFCNDDPYAVYATNYNTNGNWLNDPQAINMTAAFQDGINVPCRAVRINVASFAVGSTPTTFTVVQVGVR